MLTFLTGCDAGAKREFIASELEKAAAADRPAYLLVPDQVGFERDRELLFRLGERTANKIRVSGFMHFAGEVLEMSGAPVKPAADDAAQAALMSLALRSVGDSLRIFSRHYRRPAGVQSLLSAYRAVTQAGADPDDLRKLSAKLTGKLREKTEELSLVFSAFEALVSDRFSSESDNLRRAAVMLPACGFGADAVFYVDDFRGFTGLQVRFLAALAAQAEVFLSLPGNSPADADGGPVFEHAMKNRSRLSRAAKSAGAQVCSREIPVSGGALDPLRLHLFGTPGTEDVPVTLACAYNKYDECERIALQIRELLENGCRAGEIAVYIRDEAYRTSLVSALRKAGVPVYDDRRRPLTQFPLPRLMLSAASLAAKGFDTGEVLNYVKTDLTGIDVEDCALLENYVYRWQIDGKRWELPFTGNPLGFGAEETEQTAAELERINGIRLRVVAPVLRLRSALTANSAADGCRALYLLLRDTAADKSFLEYAAALHAAGDAAGALDCAAVWDVCVEALDALAAAAEGQTVEPVYFYELLTLILSGNSVGDIPAGLDQVKIGAADRARYLSPRVVFAAGFGEASYPLRDVGGVFTSRDLRQLYDQSLDLEALPEDRFAEEKLLVWQMLTCAAADVRISYAAFSPAGDRLEPSPFLEDLKNAAGGRLAEIRSPEKEALITSPDAALAVYADVMRDGTVFAASLRSALETQGHGDRLQALERAVRGVDGTFSDPAQARRLFGNEMYFSASKAETYAKCPFLFFCRYGMGAEPIRLSRMDARIHGLIVHKVLEDLLTLHAGVRLGDLPEAQLLAEVREAMERYIADCMGGREQLPPALRRSLERTQRVIMDILQRMRSEMNTCAFLPVSAELQIGGKDAEIPAYSLTLPDGGKVVLYGSVDRVDLMDTGAEKYVRVVDYKTGGKDFRLGDVFDGLNMQMLLYLFAICRNGKQKFGDVIPAGVLYVPANNSGEKLGRHGSEEEIRRQKLKNGRMNGVILEDATVIKGMESAARGVYINAEISNDGRLKGTFLTLEEFGLLHRKIDDILRETGMQIHLGNVPALPVETGSQTAVCDYCDYSAVCLKERGCEKRKRTDLKHEDARAKLRGESGNTD